ncbi:MAG: DNA translocase FtsK 4TM domain-containing protein [Proteobacteria bacterium]|nr:DNA translocase FtsK 4TM domain-containing protein [Pseudomonadota bacterium]
MQVERSEAQSRPLLPSTLEDRLLGWLLTGIGIGLLLIAAAGWIALATWSHSDPSLTHATSGTARNLLGPLGAIFADLILQMLGFGAVVAFVGPAWAGIELVLNERLARPRMRLFLFVAALATLSGALSSLPSPLSWPINHGLGGALGDIVYSLSAGIAGIILPGRSGTLAGLLLFAGGMSLLSAGLGLGRRELQILTTSRLSLARLAPTHVGATFEPAAHANLAEPSLDGLDMPSPRATGKSQAASTRRPEHAFDHATEAASRSMAARFAPEGGRRATSSPPQRSAGELLASLMPIRAPATDYRKPSLNILKRPPPTKPGAEHTQPVLRGSARLLEDVLSDFGIKGEVKGIKPGPVVTLFEVEPARGTKASRIIALADDIARSMSAVSARVAPIPGRNVIGIELPNVKRDTVYLRELLEHETWRTAEAELPVVLGKGIGGEPIVADLARMPHLLIAGTTGSGKSVGVNALIMSLLYRLSPAECRLMMIDPKMLELSVYNGIPHLLAPVVTDPHRAAAALAWAVIEMEERYKRMAELGVRNIAMFNVRVKNAKKRGELPGRTVQTGFDEHTGDAIYVREDMAPEPMPYIVIIVDEFADLMAVAGKEVEGSVQRLAQMARAAGIHLVMATQRPSVDVVTGTIKANFPTRIAFRVASKIDSRTILGEQGAEQLLGSGDMLYAPGSGQVLRVHGPFVSDEEVERVASGIREGTEPAYVDALVARIEADLEDDRSESHATAQAVAADELFDRAVAIVHRDGKASTSYLQRRLGIGYNRAALLIERMEEEGIVSAPDASGRRRVLIAGDDPDGSSD